MQEFRKNNVNIYYLEISDLKKVYIQNISIKDPQSKQLSTLPEIAKDSSKANLIIAGVNGGFFNMATGSRPDDMCPSSDAQLYGTSDSYLDIENQLLAKNCVTRPVMEYFYRQAPKLMMADSGSTVHADSGYVSIGGGPTLVINGEIKFDNGSYPWLNTKAARTAVGYKNNGSIYLVTVEQVQGGSVGFDIKELAEFMKNYLHTDNAMNLDGGGSTTMCAGNLCSRVLNTPKNGTARKIFEGLFIVKRKFAIIPASLALDGEL